MNIQEAIKSGKPFKRTGDKVYYLSRTVTDCKTFYYEDILADDWEIETVKKELSAKDIIDVLNKWNTQPYRMESIRDFIIKELGLN